MEILFIVLHVFLSIVLISMILLQQGKGADAGAAFGGGGSASQTVFGGRGSKSFFARATAFVTVLLLGTSIALNVINKRKVSDFSDSIPVEKTVKEENKTEVPTLTQPNNEVQKTEESDTKQPVPMNNKKQNTEPLKK